MADFEAESLSGGQMDPPGTPFFASLLSVAIKIATTNITSMKSHRPNYRRGGGIYERARGR